MMRYLQEIGAWFDRRLAFSEVILPMLRHPVPRAISGPMGWWYVFGSASLTFLMIQIVTGILLAMVYVPSADQAYESLLYMDYHMYLGDDLLMKLDRASMACSLELRTPYLDQRLVEFTAGLPMAFKMRGLKTKYLFKKALEGRLPSKILYRQKRGFSVPVGRWMREELKPLVQNVLAREKLVRDGIFDPDVVQRLLEEHWSRRFDHRRGLRALLMFQIWHDRWVRGSGGAAG